MPRTYARIAFTLLLSSMGLSACGGSSKHTESPPAQSPPAESATTSEAPAPSSEAPPATSDGDAGAAPTGSAPAAGSTPKRSRSPRDVLEAKDTVFFLSYADSAPQESAEASCTQKAKKDPKKMAACMAKARESAKIDAEGHRFFEDKKGERWWAVIRRKGNTLVTLHKVRFKYGAETADSIVIKPEGKDTGSKPWRKLPSEMKFEVPSDDRIVVRDPKLGKLVYEAKVGIAGGG
jgi:hypothetical protein